MPYIKSVALSDQLWERVQKQQARWAKSLPVRTMGISDSASVVTPAPPLTPNMNQFLKQAVLIYVENMEAMTDEDLEIDDGKPTPR